MWCLCYTVGGLRRAYCRAWDWPSSTSTFTIGENEQLIVQVARMNEYPLLMENGTFFKIYFNVIDSSTYSILVYHIEGQHSTTQHKNKHSQCNKNKRYTVCVLFCSVNAITTRSMLNTKFYIHRCRDLVHHLIYAIALVFIQVSSSFCFCFWTFDFGRFCVVIRFFLPRHNGQWPPTSKDFYTRSYSLHYFLILFSRELLVPFL